MKSKEIKICDECESEYFAKTSKMANLCPNCSHYLYGYKNCQHKFENGRCVNCYLEEKIYKKIMKNLNKNFKFDKNININIPYSLHDSRVKGIKFHNKMLTLQVDSIFEYTDGEEKNTKEEFVLKTAI